MQRLSRIQAQNLSTKTIELYKQYDEILGILKSHLPQNTVNVFARPHITNNGQVIEWYTNLEGQAQLIQNEGSSKTLYQQSSQTLSQSFEQIHKLNQDLTRKGLLTQEQSTKLSRLLEITSPHTNHDVFLVNKQPVIANWSVVAETKSISPIPKMAVAPSIIAATSTATAASKKNWLLWLLIFSLLLMLLFALWWPFFRPKTHEPHLAEHKTQSLVAEQIIPREDQSNNNLIPSNSQNTVGPQNSVDTEQPSPVCRQIVTPSKAPQLVLVVNNASAMSYSILESSEDISRFDEQLTTGRISLEEYLHMQRDPNRSSATKGSIIQLLASIDNSVDIGLIELQSCLSVNDRNSAKSYGMFHGNQRKGLEHTIGQMQLRKNRVPGIPLYEGLERALTMVDGINEEAVILLITDGNGECTNRNFEPLIEKIQQRDKLTINVVRLNSTWDNTDFLATLSGGKVFNSESSTERELNELIARASQPETILEICE